MPGRPPPCARPRQLLARQGHRLVVVTPTLKAAEVAAAETGADGHSAAWLIHQHGWRWDDDGHWTRQPDPTPDPAARLRPGDLLLVDEAGMLDQDTARALLTIADETGARVAFVGDRHQLPAVGRGGVLDHAVAWAHPTAVVTLETVHRFTDPDYAALSLRMRTGDDPGAVFDALHRRGQIVIHPTEVERTAALAEAGAAGDLVIADTREQVADLNAAIRDQRRADAATDDRRSMVTTARGERIGLGDRVATRRNDPDLAGREPPDLDRHRHRRGRQPHPSRPRARPGGPGRVRDPVRRARLRHHRPRRPGRDRRPRPRRHRRAPPAPRRRTSR